MFNLFDVIHSMRKFKWHCKWTNMVHNIKKNITNQSTISFVLHGIFCDFLINPKPCYYAKVKKDDEEMLEPNSLDMQW